jgi:signal transduction histidine kinase
MILFLKTLESHTVFTEEEIKRAAILTFINVIILSLICTTVDAIRREFMVNRPVKKITDAAEEIMQGDLSARIELGKSVDPNNELCIVSEYFNRMAEELSGMETLRTDFISNVSHELKTPLSVMQNYATMLCDKNLPEEKREEYAKAIISAARSLSNMVTNILKLNKLENQKIYPIVKPYDLGEQLCNCFVAFEDVWEDKNIDIDTDIEDNITVTADPELLSLAWNNLFSNAIKFTESGGKISLSLKYDGENAVVKVSDTGCGISPEVGKHIFEKFYQGDTSHAAKGNGLGLALVKRVVDIVGGDIFVQSEVGKGSTFTVKIRGERNGEVQSIS